MHKLINGKRVELTAEEIASIEKERKQAAKEQKNSSYKLQRQRRYPSIVEQLDMLWHAMDREEIPKAEAFYAAIKEVKESNPKP